MLSAQTISQATANFFDDLHQRASELMTFLEDSKIDKIDQLQKFEKSFKVNKQIKDATIYWSAPNVCKILTLLFLMPINRKRLLKKKRQPQKKLVQYWQL